MLKIKDNVDLKELEKLGFRLDEDEDGRYYIRKIWWYYMGVDEDTREIEIWAYSDGHDPVNADDHHLDILYDLITAGLVEKVEKEE